MRVFTRPAFLTPGDCGRIRAAMDLARREPGEVLGAATTQRDDIRRVSSLEVEEDVIAFVEGRLDAARADIAGFFGVELVSREGSGFLRYSAGGFYAPHRDRGDVPAWPDAVRRQAAVVLFLSDSRDAVPGGAFSGGVLRLFVDAAEPVIVAPREGLLVAFPAAALHEVTPVTSGTRDAIVDWFYGA